MGLTEPPEVGQFWEVTAGMGTGHVVEIVEVSEATALRGSVATVRPLGGIDSDSTQIPLDERWVTGLKQIHACPVCEQPLPGPHLGTCRYSMMHTGKPELQSQVPVKPPSAKVASGDASSLADRIRALTKNAEMYRALDESAEQIISTAAEIDSNMTYLGMDDVIHDLAAEVEMLERAAVTMPVEVLSPKSGDAIVAKLPKATHPSVFEAVQDFLGDKFPNNPIFVAHEDAELAVIPRSEFEDAPD